MLTGSRVNKFAPTKKSLPCPICGDVSGKCRITDLGVLCMSYPDGIYVNGFIYVKPTRDNLWGIYLANHLCNWSIQPRLSKPKPIQSTKQEEPISRQKRHQYFEAIAKKLPSLSSPDLELLQQKGLEKAEIKNTIFFSHHLGIFILFQDVDGLFVGAQIRLREKSQEGKRYIWFTPRFGVHLEDGSIPVAVWQSSQPTNILSICEGYLKSYISYCKYHRANLPSHWLGFGSVGYLESGWSEIERTIRKLQPQKIRFYPDSNCANNPTVRKNYIRFWEKLKECFQGQCEIEIATWNHEFSKSLDVDEIEPERPRYLPLESYIIYFKRYLEYPVAKRLQTWMNLMKKYKFILDKSPPGTGKSYDAGNFPEPAIYISSDHRNPTVPTLGSWADVEARHKGLYRDQHHYWRRVSSEKDNIQIPANCWQSDLHQKLREFGYQSNFLCNKCKLFEKCISGRGDGYGYLYERQRALMSSHFRVHPDSIPSPLNFDYSKRVLIIEEAADISLVQEVFISVTEIEKSIEKIDELNLSSTEKLTLKNFLSEIITRTRSADVYGEVNPVSCPPLASETQLCLYENALNHLQTALEPDAVAEEEWQKVTSGKERYELAVLNRMLQDYSSQPESIISELKRGFSPGLVWLIQQNPYWLTRYGIKVYRLKTELRQAIQQARAVIFLDATASPEIISLLYGIPLEQIFTVSAQVPSPTNLTVLQVPDLGRLGRQRGRDQQQRLQALLNHWQQEEPRTRVFDLLSYSPDAVWWRDSRGRNNYTDAKQIVLVGTPGRNYNQTYAHYLALGGEPKNYKAFYHQITQNDIIQGIGRIRAYQRPHEQLTVYFVSNFPLQFPNLIRRNSISFPVPAAWPKPVRLLYLAAYTYQELKRAGISVSQTRIANILKVRRETVSRYWQEILALVHQLASNEGNRNDRTKASERRSLPKQLTPKQQHLVMTLANRLSYHPRYLYTAPG